MANKYGAGNPERMAIARRCADELYRRGARRVRIFGSVRYDLAPDPLSDIDLAVEGLTRDVLRTMQRTFRRRERIKIDLVGLEDAGPGFRQSALKGVLL